MYFFFILFFVSLVAIIIMIGRKFRYAGKMGQEEIEKEDGVFIASVLDLDKIKNTTIKNLKKIEHILIWIIVRTYLISRNFINRKRKEIALKIKNRLNRNRESNISKEKKEVSKYMKVISEYRQKIKKVKYKIKEEEGIE